MSQDIMKEIIFLGHSLLMGVSVTFLYDWFLIMRRVVKHNIVLISLEDFLFWVICAVSVFAMLYRENNGTLRWFAVAGAFCGMLLYKKTISHFLIRKVSGVLQKILQLIGHMFRFLLKPVSAAADKGKQGYTLMKREGNKISKYIKNKLTAWKKVLKMILCKR